MKQSSYTGQNWNQSFVRHSSMDQGYYGGYKKDSGRIPLAAWVFVAVFVSIGFLVLKVGSVVGF